MFCDCGEQRKRTPSKPSTPSSEDVPTLFQHAMNLSRGIDPAKVREEATVAARDKEVLCDHGDYKRVLRHVERSILFSEEAFWSYIDGKERANVVYLSSTTLTDTFRYVAAVRYAA